MEVHHPEGFLRIVFLEILHGLHQFERGQAELCGFTAGCRPFAGALCGQRAIEIWSSLPFLYTIMIVSSIIVPVYLPGRMVFVQPSLWLLVIILAAFDCRRFQRLIGIGKLFDTLLRRVCHSREPLRISRLPSAPRSYLAGIFA